MSLVIGFLTFILVLNCLILIFLVLIQLPKKEAGAGLAFGGGTTDALFGAGSGTTLTKITKYAAGFFLLLAACLTILNARRFDNSGRNVEKLLTEQAIIAPVTGSTNQLLTLPPVTTNLNTPLSVTSTNSPQPANTKAPTNTTPAPAARP